MSVQYPDRVRGLLSSFMLDSEDNTVLLVLFLFFKQPLSPSSKAGGLVTNVQGFPKGHQSHFLACDFSTPRRSIKGATFLMT